MTNQPITVEVHDPDNALYVATQGFLAEYAAHYFEQTGENHWFDIERGITPVAEEFNND